MQERQDALRDELVAILGAGRELSADTDMQLAEAFVHYVEHQQERETAKVVETAPHQPHYSLKIAGGAWGAALTFLFLMLVLDQPVNPVAFIVVSALLLSLVAALTRGFLYLARYGWQLPDVHVRIVPPARKPQNRL